MSLRDFLMKGHVYTDQSITNWFVSFKIDGMRCLWLPFTRGMEVGDVPFANTLKQQPASPTVCSGLWSYYGKIIHAPSIFLDNLPDICLDGELYHRDGFQATMCAVKGYSPTFAGVRFYVFDAPPVEVVLGNGTVTWFGEKIHFVNLWQWARKLGWKDCVQFHWKYSTVYDYLVKVLEPSAETFDSKNFPVITLVHQTPLLTPDSLDNCLSVALHFGWEGLVVRNPDSVYVCKRSHNLLKVKPFTDAEATVVGYQAGKGRLVGCVGALIVQGSIDGKLCQFEIGTGLTDLDRSAEGTPKIGSIVTYRYHRLTDDNKPREPRYFRKRDEL